MRYHAVLAVLASVAFFSAAIFPWTSHGLYGQTTESHSAGQTVEQPPACTADCPLAGICATCCEADCCGGILQHLAHSGQTMARAVTGAWRWVPAIGRAGSALWAESGTASGRPWRKAPGSSADRPERQGSGSALAGGQDGALEESVHQAIERIGIECVVQADADCVAGDLLQLPPVALDEQPVADAPQPPAPGSRARLAHHHHGGARPADVAVRDGAFFHPFAPVSPPHLPAHPGPAAGPDTYLQRKAAYEDHWREKIEQTLSFVPGLLIGINVELDPTIHRVTRFLEQAPQGEGSVSEGEETVESFAGGRWREEMVDVASPLKPIRVTVSLAVPQSYIARVSDSPAGDSTSPAAKSSRIRESLQQLVSNLIPRPESDEESRSQVVVSFYHDNPPSAPLAVSTRQRPPEDAVGRESAELNSPAETIPPPAPLTVRPETRHTSSRTSSAAAPPVVRSSAEPVAWTPRAEASLPAPIVTAAQVAALVLLVGLLVHLRRRNAAVAAPSGRASASGPGTGDGLEQRAAA